MHLIWTIAFPRPSQEAGLRTIMDAYLDLALTSLWVTLVTMRGFFRTAASLSFGCGHDTAGIEDIEVKVSHFQEPSRMNLQAPPILIVVDHHAPR